MSTAYKFNDPEGIYFISIATVEWIDVFSRKEYIEIVLESLKHCQKEKGLIIYAWCIMTNHLHLIISVKEGFIISDILRDFKKFTSSKIIKAISENISESRKNWVLWILKKAGEKNSNNKNFQFWRQDNHPEELISNKFKDQKLEYIHKNPVEAGLVDNPEDYRYSSARDYAGYKGLLDIAFL
ncbi:transposase [soil metagenome]